MLCLRNDHVNVSEGQTRCQEPFLLDDEDAGPVADDNAEGPVARGGDAARSLADDSAEEPVAGGAVIMLIILIMIIILILICNY